MPLDTILIAEDSIALQEVYWDMFRGKYEIIMASEGRKACEHYVECNQRILGIITDYELADGFHGNRVSSFIRTYERLMQKPEKPIIMVSGRDASWLRELEPKPEVDAFVRKPFDLDHLYRIIHKIMGVPTDDPRHYRPG